MKVTRDNAGHGPSPWRVGRARPGRDSGHAVHVGRDPYLTYHGSEVMPTSTTYPIFWLPAGRHFQPDGNDAQFEAGVAQFFRDIGGTHSYNIVTQYSKDAQGSLVKNGPILNQSTLGGSWVDTTAYPHTGTSQDPLQLSD